MIQHSSMSTDAINLLQHMLQVTACNHTTVWTSDQGIAGTRTELLMGSYSLDAVDMRKTNTPWRDQQLSPIYVHLLRQEFPQTQNCLCDAIETATHKKICMLQANRLYVRCRKKGFQCQQPLHNCLRLRAQACNDIRLHRVSPLC